MKNMIILFLLVISELAYSQIYESSYVISLVPSYSNYKEGKNDVENNIQSFFRNNFMDSTLMRCISNNALTEVTLFTKMDLQYLRTGASNIFLKDKDTLPNGAYGDSYTVNVNTSSVDKKRFLIDRANAVSYDFISTNCRPMSVTSFIPTNENKEINGWRCTKWIPVNDLFKNKIDIWICDSIPKEVSCGWISDDFTGGIVTINFKKGISYNLTNYSLAKVSPPSFSETILCKQYTADTFNFVEGMLKEDILMDLKYQFK